MLRVLPRATTLLAEKRYDADWYRTALAERKIDACTPSRTNRKVPIPHDPVLYRKRHKIENMFGRLKDRRLSLPCPAFKSQGVVLYTVRTVYKIGGSHSAGLFRLGAMPARQNPRGARLRGFVLCGV